MRSLALVGVLVCLGSVPSACSVPEVVFASDDGGAADDAGSQDGGNADEMATTPGDDAGAAIDAGSAPAPKPPSNQCPAHPPMGAQGCCGATPCVGAGCTMQCSLCDRCGGQVCCVGMSQGGDEQKHPSATVSCAPDTKGCGG